MKTRIIRIGLLGMLGIGLGVALADQPATVVSLTAGMSDGTTQPVTLTTQIVSDVTAVLAPPTTQVVITSPVPETQPLVGAVDVEPGPTTVPTTQPAAAVAHRRFGVNLELVSPYSRSMVYTDLVTQSILDSVTAAGDGKATVGADGWPVGDFGITIWQQATATDAGVYKIVFAGQYTSLVVSKGSTIVSQPVYDPGAQTTTALVQFNPLTVPSMWMRFLGTSGTRHLQVIRPGYDVGGPRFTNQFLALLNAIHPGVIRGMDFLRTNGSTQSDWSLRPTACPTYFTQNGAPLEDLIGICNKTGADLWLNIPIQATTAYMEAEADCVSKRLNPNAYVYLEYGNENWNTAGVFKIGHDFNVSSALKGGAAFSGNPEQMGWQRTAWICSYASGIFRNALGKDGAGVDRVRPVLCGQGANLATLETGLAWLKVRNIVPTIYGIGIAPYAAITPDLSGEGWQVHPETWGAVKNFAGLGKTYGVATCWYECGVDLSGQPNPRNGPLQHDPRMAGLVQTYLGGGDAMCTGPYNFYNAASYYSNSAIYGLTDNASDLTQPKLVGAAAFSATH